MRPADLAARLREHPRLALAMVLALFALVAGSAMRHTSPTFDETIFAASGARGFATGKFTLVLDHPRLPQYLFGLPLYLTGAKLPDDAGRRIDFKYRYIYGEELYWEAGNDPEWIAFVTRLPGLACALLLIVATYALARRQVGPGGALLAATLVALLPDVLAHAGLAYNDIPFALGLVVSMMAIDAAVRRPTPWRASIAGVATALTLSVKLSALVLGPAAVVLVVLEGLSRRGDERAWRRGIAIGAVIGLLAGYAVLVLVYQGDLGLSELVVGTWITFGVLPERTTMILGRKGTGFWYFFPVVFVLKTAMAFHALIALAAVGAWLARRRTAWRERLAHPGRVPVVAATLFAGAAMASGINIGSRHMLPMLPFVCVLVAHGLVLLHRRWQGRAAALTAALLAWNAGSILSYYPYFIPYVSEYTRGRLELYETLVDSSTDWGHGMLALRDYAREHPIEPIALAFFGSAPPEGYGIRYSRLPSFMVLAVFPPDPEPPRSVVISATHLAGLHVKGDPYAGLRGRKPVAIVAGSLYVFDADAVQALSPEARKALEPQR